MLYCVVRFQYVLKILLWLGCGTLAICSKTQFLWLVDESPSPILIREVETVYFYSVGGHPLIRAFDCNLTALPVVTLYRMDGSYFG